MVKQAGVGCDVRPRCAPDRFLVDGYHPAHSSEVTRDRTLELLGAIGKQHVIAVGHWLISCDGASEMLADQGRENLADETGFA
ncbi:hypothetical protein B277_04257 [Janibacter hoylei PVAS-1]|uniref:Uncharacterized protein n=1 Tax=Janibacter hoylei PVAS-1 TaxID=1210046 RepID=K1DZK3_9MICO|nr:hypothetical protein B277_04257 [Janibacter hoylei PVAS-1]